MRRAVPAASSHPRYTLYSAAVPALRRIVPRELPLPLVCGAVAGALVVALLTFVPLVRRRPVAPVPDLALPPRRVPALEQPVVRGPVRVRELQRPLLPARGAHGRAAGARGLGRRCSPASFAAVCRREWGGAARGPAIAFACTTPFVSIVSGSYPFTAGAACAALALLALQRGRRVAVRAWRWSARSASRRSPSPCCWRSWPACCSAIPSRSSPPAGTGRRSPSSWSRCSRACSCSGRSRAAASTPTT